MEHILLWLLRTLIMICLGLAFAMPMLRTRKFAWMGNTPRDVAIIIDASYSMDYNLGRQTVWDKALDVAGTIIQGLGENDRFCIYVARDQPDPIIAEPTSDREDGLSRIKALKRGYTSSSLTPALIAANDALQSESRRREREIFILTDGQALPWDKFGSESGEAEDDVPHSPDAWDPSSIDEKTAVFVALLGASEPQNIAPADVILTPPILLEGSSPTITALLTSTGNAIETVVALHMDAKEIGRRSARLGAGADSAPSFTIPSLPTGTHAVRIETPDDNLPIDNTFHLLVRVKEELPTLCVGPKEDTFFLRAALQATTSGDTESKARWVAPEALTTEPLHTFASIFLCNSIPMPGQSSSVLEQHVKSGGLLAIFPGPAASPDDYPAWQSLPGIPTGTAEVRRTRRKRMLTWEKPRHPLLHALQDSLAPPVVTLQRHLTWNALPPDTETLVTLGDGTPFLLDRPYGLGRVLLFSVTADRTWSDFPLSPFYLPIVRQIIEYGAASGTFSPYVWSCEALSLKENLPEATSASRISGPDGNAVPVRSSIVQGRTILHAEGMTHPGIYALTQPGHNPTPALAVNIDRRESNLTPALPEEITQWVGIKNLQIASDKEALLKMISDLRIGRTFGEHLLWLALLLALAEFVYATMLVKERPTLAAQLKVKPSGKVSGHTPHADRATAKGGDS